MISDILLPDTSAALALSIAALLGLGYGLGPCLLRCLPLMMPAFLAAERPGSAVLMPLVAARMVVYASYGLLAAVSGRWITEQVPPVFASALLGAGCLVAGGVLLIQQRKPPQGCACPSRSSHILGGVFGGSALQGLGLTLIPCAPFATVLLYCAAVGNPLLGLMMGICFGLGAAALPMLLLGKLLLSLSHGLKQGLGHWLHGISKLSACALMLFGLFTMYQSFVPLL